MRRNSGVVGTFVLCWLVHGVAADSRNLTTTLAVDQRANKNTKLVGVKLKLSKHKSHSDDDDEPPTDAAAEIADGSRVYSKWETGWFIAGCYGDREDDRDLPVGPFSINSDDPYPVCATYCMDKGNRYAGLQLSPDDASTVLCYCGLTVGRYGISQRCTVRCPGTDVDTVQTCGNLLANTVIYVYRVRRSTFFDLSLGTSSLVIVGLLLVNTAVVTGFAVYLVIVARRMLRQF